MQRESDRFKVTFTIGTETAINPFSPEFIMVIFIHYNPRIAVAILDL